MVILDVILNLQRFVMPVNESVWFSFNVCHLVKSTRSLCLWWEVGSSSKMKRPQEAQSCPLGAIWCRCPQPLFISLMWKMCLLTHLRKCTQTIKTLHSGNVYWCVCQVWESAVSIHTRSAPWHKFKTITSTTPLTHMILHCQILSVQHRDDPNGQ